MCQNHISRQTVHWMQKQYLCSMNYVCVWQEYNLLSLLLTEGGVVCMPQEEVMSFYPEEGDTSLH